jgi:diguanylate cyclase (GGDEF)-like protein/PAS domain S-box-containing protein
MKLVEMISKKSIHTVNKFLFKTLQNKNHEYEIFFRITKEAIAILDMESKFLDFNDAYLEMTGFTREELLLKSCIGLSAQEDVPRSIVALEEVMHRGHKTNYEKTCIVKDGKRVIVSMNISLLPDRERILISVKDITEKRELENKLIFEKELAQITLASIGDAVVTTDGDCNVTFINSVASELMGYTLDEARGQYFPSLFNIVNETTRKEVKNPAIDALQKRSSIELANHTVLLSNNGNEYHIEDCASPIILPNGEIIGIVVVFRDVTDKYQLLEHFQWQAMHDSLTGLPNRVLLMDRFHQAIATTRRDGNLLAVCMLDLDEFKPINDQLGHYIGDELLIQVTKRLSGALRESDTLARIGGDEFVLLLGGMTSVHDITEFVSRILKLFEMSFDILSNSIHVSCSIGMSIYPDDDADVDTLLRHADQAMYDAKQHGRNRYHFFDVEHAQHQKSFNDSVEKIRQAFRDREFLLYYQPKVNLKQGTIEGAEALIRWRHNGVLITPDKFLPQIEQTDLIVDVGEWVIREALIQLSKWSKTQYNHFTISVNIAARHFQSGSFTNRLKILLDEYPTISPILLEIEILESVVLHEIEAVYSIIKECQAMGVKFALDDFGTGYSSLNYLKRLPAETLKIDQTFVRDMLYDNEDQAIVEAIINISSIFDKKVVAEGVESAEQGILLMHLGCEVIQGYYIARPMDIENLEIWADHYIHDNRFILWGKSRFGKLDFPLTVAKLDHIKWVDELCHLVQTKSKCLEKEVEDHTQCRFGKWYYSNGLAQFSEHGPMKDIEALHRNLHAIGSDIFNFCQIGNYDESSLLCTKLINIQEQIIVLLESIEYDILLTDMEATDVV